MKGLIILKENLKGSTKKIGMIAVATFLFLTSIVLVSHGLKSILNAGYTEAVDGKPFQGSSQIEKEVNRTFEQAADPLLIMVNAEVALPDSYEMRPRLFGNKMVDDRIYGDLLRLIDDAGAQGHILWVASGFRSLEEQQAILENEVVMNMEVNGLEREEALAVSLQTLAYPGYSEHHTGLAVDFNTVDGEFEDTDEYEWLLEHAAEYGFVQRFREDKVEFTKIDCESWHFRYVGKENASEMTKKDFCLEEYCTFLRDKKADNS